VLEAAPWLSADHLAPAVHRYLQATAREQLAHQAYIAKPSPRLLEAATAAARLAWRMGDELGLTPAGHAKLKMLVAGGAHAEASLADLMVVGAEIAARRFGAVNASEPAEPPASVPEPPDELGMGASSDELEEGV